MPVPYNNSVEMGAGSFKKHYDISDKDVAPWLAQPSGIDQGLYRSLWESVEMKKKA